MTFQTLQEAFGDEIVKSIGDVKVRYNCTIDKLVKKDVTFWFLHQVISTNPSKMVFMGRCKDIDGDILIYSDDKKVNTQMLIMSRKAMLPQTRKVMDIGNGLYLSKKKVGKVHF